MAASRNPRPVCGGSHPYRVDDGTSCRAESPAPGHVDGHRTPQAAAPRKLVFAGRLRMDREKFYELYEQQGPPFGKLRDARRTNLGKLLDRVDGDSELTDIRQVAYLLATTLHEDRSLATKWVISWSPVSETGGADKSYGREEVVVDWHGNPLDANARPIEHPRNAEGRPMPVPEALKVKRRYYGRGYVQITHQENYRAMDEALGLGGRLLIDPELATDPDIAYRITSYGMRMGSFGGPKRRVEGKGFIGGHKLADYINGTKCDYHGAREIINGHDKADTIQGYARKFESMLKISRGEEVEKPKHPRPAAHPHHR